MFWAAASFSSEVWPGVSSSSSFLGLSSPSSPYYRVPSSSSSVLFTSLSPSFSRFSTKFELCTWCPYKNNSSASYSFRKSSYDYLSFDYLRSNANYFLSFVIDTSVFIVSIGDMCTSGSRYLADVLSKRDSNVRERRSNRFLFNSISLGFLFCWLN